MTRLSHVKTPCKHCPYRRDVTPFLHPSRGEELAYSACNPFNDFACHETTENIETEYGGARVETERSLICAGFLTLQAAEGYERHLPRTFEPSFDLVYDSAYDMAEAYSEEWGEST